MFRRREPVDAADLGQLSDLSEDEDDVVGAPAQPREGGFSLGAGGLDDGGSDDSFDLEAEARGLAAVRDGEPSSFYSPGGFESDEGSDAAEPTPEVPAPSPAAAATSSTRPLTGAAIALGADVLRRLEAARQSPGSSSPAVAPPAPPVSVPAPESPLPEGWMATSAPDGRVYYFHAATRETSWTRPVAGPAAAMVAAAASATALKEPAVPATAPAVHATAP